jgi:predicted MPP superfamily phosphohydrolase
VYSVAGNHDEELPGPPIQHELHQALLALNIEPIEGRVVTTHPSVYVYGTGDLWAGKADLTALRFFPQDKPWIVVAHNPDTVDHIPSGLSHRPLMLSGHTHGGQVDIPWLTAWALKKESKYGFQVGLYDMPNAQVYVTAGTGMVAAPLRFLMPPSIDLLELV